MKKAFVIIYSEACQPWIHHANLKENARRTCVIPILLLSRWDGKFGFPGGYLEKEETFKEGVVREAFEEINFYIEEENLELVEENKNMTIFSYKIPFDEMYEIQRNMIDAIDYGTEIFGSIILLAGIKENMDEYMSLPFIENAKTQLENFVKRKQYEY